MCEPAAYQQIQNNKLVVLPNYKLRSKIEVNGHQQEVSGCGLVAIKTLARLLKAFQQHVKFLKCGFANRNKG